MSNSVDVSANIHSLVCDIPRAKLLLDSLSQSSQFGIAIFGGAIRDIIAFNSLGHDLDILVYGEKREGFSLYVKEAAERIGAEMIDYPGSHIVLKTPESAVTFDIHYPKHSYLEGLVRSDFTVNGMGYLWKERRIEDPLGGVSDLEKGRLVIHSPQYIVTDAPTFPRMFRTAAKLNFPIEGETEEIVRRFAPLISLHSGRTNVRTLLEFLKFLSLEKIAHYLRQMTACLLVEGLFPELAICATVQLPSQQSILARNAELGAMLENMQMAEGVKTFLDSSVGFGITNRGLLRLGMLFLDLGYAYEAFRPEAPYIKAMIGSHAVTFVERMEKNLISHAASRYQDAPDLCRFLAELPLAFKIMRTSGSAREADAAAASLSPSSRSIMQIMIALISAAQKNLNRI